MKWHVLSRFLGLLLALGLSAGCGVEFEPGSTVKSLRVLAVQKDVPYARPGERVTLRMHWHDGLEGERGPVQRLWLAGCYNPPGDLYTGCFTSLAGVTLDAQNPGSLEGVFLGEEDVFQFQVPENIIENHAPSPDLSIPPFGTAFVFFAACRGTLGLRATAEPLGFPLECRDGAGKLLGADDFVAGYSQLFAYQELRNRNPVITGFRVGDRDVRPDCLDDECLATPIVAPDCALTPELCVATCVDDGDSKCPAIRVSPIVDQNSIDPDDLARLKGRNYTEQTWINYYTTKGGLKSGARLVNDAVTGLNPDYGTEWYAPSATGPVTVFAVVRDNRGGSAFARVTLLAR